MQTSVLSMPSDPSDPRFRAPRSPNCPNDITQDETPKETAQTANAGLCGFCAWGFYTMDSSDHQHGEPISELTLTPVLTGDGHAGYKAQCGRVKLYRDEAERIGAVRLIDGIERFFPGIPGNWAFERYTRQHPELKQSVAA